jgi:transposase
MRAEWAEPDRCIAVFDEEFAASARQDEAARRLATVPGIGPINATALVAGQTVLRRKLRRGEVEDFFRVLECSPSNRTGGWLGRLAGDEFTG